MKATLTALFIFLITVGNAQESGNSRYQQTHVNRAVAIAREGENSVLLVSGLANVEADEYVAIFHVIQLGETAEKTDALLNDRIRRLKESLAANNIDTLAVKTDMVSFVPKFNVSVTNKLFSKSYNEVPDGFELQKNVLIRYKRAQQIDAIVSAAAKAEIFDLAKVDYFVSDVKKVYNDLRKQCFELLRDRMKEYELIGVRLDTMKKVVSEDFATVTPPDRYEQYHAAAKPSYSAVKQQTSSFPLKINMAEVSPSKYYSAVPYDDYDVVINPVIDRPVVQFTFQVRVSYLTFNERKEICRNGEKNN
jgi:uncharacterized protein YggE